MPPSLSYTRNGKYVAVDLGHCTDPSKRYYLKVNGVTRHPKWISGFWMVRNGYAYGFTKKFTDWQFWLQGITLVK
jgi:hypothetical protein